MNKINEGELFTKYKSSYKFALIDITVHSIYLCTAFYLTWYFRNCWISICSATLLGLLLNRTFVVFHDCCHNSYTPSAMLNYVISHITGIIVITSPNWLIDHHTHHLTNGNIENEQHYFFNETIILTKSHYLALSTKNKLLYYYYKQPYVFFTIIPLLYFGLVQRIIYAIKKYNKPHKYNKSLISIIADHAINNIGSLVYLYYIYKYEIFFQYFISLCISSSIAFMSFHNQHSYNPAYISNNDNWTQRDSGLRGSAFTQIPYYLKYFYMGIEYHHIHHMNSKIPGYNLQKYHEEVVSKSDIFDNVHKVSMRDFYNNLSLALYDEETNKYITFNELSITNKSKHKEL